MIKRDGFPNFRLHYSPQSKLWGRNQAVWAITASFPAGSGHGTATALSEGMFHSGWHRYPGHALQIAMGWFDVTPQGWAPFTDLEGEWP